MYWNPRCQEDNELVRCSPKNPPDRNSTNCTYSFIDLGVFLFLFDFFLASSSSPSRSRLRFVVLGPDPSGDLSSDCAPLLKEPEAATFPGSSTPAGFMYASLLVVTVARARRSTPTFPLSKIVCLAETVSFSFPFSLKFFGL